MLRVRRQEGPAVSEADQASTRLEDIVNIVVIMFSLANQVQDILRVQTLFS